MKDNIKEILYIQKGSFNQSEYLKIEFVQDKNILKYSINDTSKIIEVNNLKISIFIDRLFRTIDNWKTEYINNHIIDGTVWQLKIIFKNNFSKNFLGKNDYPENFENFISIKKQLLN